MDQNATGQQPEENVTDPESIARALREAHRVLSGITDNARRDLVAPVLESIRAAQRGLAEGTPAQLAGEQAAPQLRRIRELEQLVQAYDEFTSALGHELRNSLSPIFIQARYLLDTVRASTSGWIATDWLIPRLETVCQRLQNFLGTLNRIMDVSRISAGRLDLELDDVDLSELLRDVCSSREREFALAKSELQTQIQPHVTGLWDRLRLEQICSNLLSNAVRYGSGKPVVLTLTADELRAYLTVRDFGIGIAEQDQTRIFQRFERARHGPHSGGFGIGLWIVRENCAAMKGSVQLQSRLGGGATFTVTLPRRPEYADE